MCLTPKIVDSSYSSQSLELSDFVDNCDYLDWSCGHELLTNRINQLCIVQFNIRGIHSEYHDLLDICNKLDNPKIIVLCKTWLKLS